MKILLFTSVSALFLLLSFVPHANGDLKSQKQALLNFAAAFPHNRRKINWFSSNSVCSSWVGVTCNSNRTNVLALRLPGIGLSGPIPAKTLGKLDTLETLSLRSNRLDGEIPPDILSLKSLHNLYLQSNNLSGGIPSSFSPQLSVLDLSLNSLTGSIPPALRNLQNLTSLSLQNNSLTGAIPALNTTTLKHLNLGFNQLNGSIPSSLQKYPASSFEGNSELCGTPLSHCPELSPAPAPAPVPAPSRGFFPLAPSPAPPLYSPIPSPNSSPIARQEPTGGGSRKGLSKGSIVAIAASSSAALLLLVAIAALCCFKKSAGQGSAAVPKAKGARSEPTKEDFGSGVQEAEKNKLVFFEGSAAYGFDLEDLLRASAEVLGKGSCGTTYKALLEEGNTVVVKRLKELIVGKKEFELQIEAVGRVGQHPNVAPLRAYYYSKDERLLVYDYAPIGSLSALLHGNKEIGQPPLDWESRLKVSLGVAKGIHHIHSASGGKFVHGNIKSSNVLLTQHHLDARVSDFGLATLMSHPSRAAGYRAPEVVETRKLTQKSDVYSFGVVLLEMLTGKSPVKLPPGQVEALDLPRWVQSVVREEWTAEVFDVQLMQYQNVEEEMVQLLQVAMACVAKTPDARPDMAEVVKMIEGIRPTPHINVNE